MSSTSTVSPVSQRRETTSGTQSSTATGATNDTQSSSAARPAGTRPAGHDVSAPDVFEDKPRDEVDLSASEDDDDRDVQGLVDQLASPDKKDELQPSAEEDDLLAKIDALKEENEALAAELEELKAQLEAEESGEETTDDENQAATEQPAEDAAPPAQSASPGVSRPSGGSSSGGGSKGPSVEVKAPNGFLWKPVSDSDGNLAILLPPGMTGDVKEVRVLSPDGSQVLATGKPTGVGNGGREHFRFGMPGGSFPPGSIVQIVMKDGSTQQIPIDQPGMRGEGRG